MTAPTVLLVALWTLTGARTRSVPVLRPASTTLGALLVLDVVHSLLASVAASWARGEPLTVAQAWAMRLDGVLIAGAWPGVVAHLLWSEYAIWMVSPSMCDVREEGHASPRWPSVFHASPREAASQVGGAVARRQMHQVQSRAVEAGAVFAASILYGAAAVATARTHPAAWLGLLVAPRFAVGALAWWVSRQKDEGPGAEAPRPSRRVAGFTVFRPLRARPKSLGMLPTPQRPEVAASRCSWKVNPSLRIAQLLAAFQVSGAAFVWSRWGDVQALSCVCWVACGWVVWRAG